MFAAPTTALQVYVIVGVLASIAALVLLALPASRRAYA
jgi:ribose/xylose/arabinose/galactoside ABC-type transport system permease subunit